MSKDITIPKDLDLRDYQKPAWNYFANGGKRGSLVWHRRTGKDLITLCILIAAAARRVDNYWHILPFYNQARKAIWEARTRDGRAYLDFIPRDFIASKRNQDMCIEFKNGSTYRLVGGDNPDSLVGAGPAGIGMSEWALQKPSLWHYIEPMLMEKDGFACFNTTPRGDNHAKDTHEYYSSHDDYFSSLLTVDDTGIITEEQIREIRRGGTPEEIIQQEYYCSFEGAIHGSYYGDLIKNLYKKKQITHVPYDTGAMVHTYWDLGMDDCTAIWFIQFIGREVHVVDYYEDNNKQLQFYADLLCNAKDYIYGSHNLPHDGARRELGGGRIDDQLKKLGLTNVKVHPRPASVYNGIQASRALMSKCWFDESACSHGIEALKQYRREWDENRGTFKTNALHDWSSHGADAFRLFAESYRVQTTKMQRPTQAKVGSAWNMKARI